MQPSDRRSSPKNALSKRQPLSLALVGIGRQGRRHLSSILRLCESQDIRISALIDIDPQCEVFAAPLNIPFFSSVEALPSNIDACVVATPTPTHFDITRSLLEHGVDVLLEKPVTAKLVQTQALVRLAERKQCIFQVGYLERYHPAFTMNRPDFSLPSQIFSERSTTGQSIQTLSELVLELMIHDLDMLATWLDREPVEIEWQSTHSAASQVGGTVDLIFSEGHRARLCAKSGATHAVRQTVVNSAAHTWEFKWESAGRTAAAIDHIERNSPANDDPITRQLVAFVEAVRTRTRPLIDGNSAIKAMQLAELAINALPIVT